MPEVTTLAAQLQTFGIFFEDCETSHLRIVELARMVPATTLRQTWLTSNTP